MYNSTQKKQFTVVIPVTSQERPLIRLCMKQQHFTSNLHHKNYIKKCLFCYQNKKHLIGRTLKGPTYQIYRLY